MNRRDRRRAKIAHEKRLREQGQNVTMIVTNPHWNLFDEVHSKFSKFPVKVNTIYDSVFCKGDVK